ncbi:venom dipeptidyl peptidase 4 [Nilaparvata lugens]|uniref:venom dipeptidyl peptidase 4 n=1 Tax=Nilaparvata lugens TaxID=108931 RepID=UPI00193C8F1E|nr:venom dipeptidyl peptidase 4 [Nilaparvata lugens]
MTSTVFRLFGLIVLLSLRVSETKRLMTLEDTVISTFRAESFIGNWISDTELTFVKDNAITLLDVTSQNQSILGEESLLKRYNATSYDVSSDKEWIALSHNCDQVYRHSSLCIYSVHELKSGFQFDVAGGKKLQLLRWSPIGHSLVYVLENDLYYQHKPGPLAADRLTTSGKAGVFYNGVADWVYEEEVLGTSRALWFSPEGTKLAYIAFDDSNVTEVHYPRYGEPGSMKWQYAEDVIIRYPKAGSNNPVVSLNVVDLRLKRRPKIDRLPAPVAEVTDDNILAEVVWIDDKNLAAAWTNRVQTVAVTMVCDSTTSECHKVLETREKDGWVEYPTLFFKNASYFATLLPQPQGEAGNFQHLTIVTDTTHIALTSGERIVERILKWNHNESLIYFLATDELSPARLHLYVIRDDGSESERCLSCDICGTSSAMLSKDMSYYVLGCRGPEVPSYAVYSSSGNFIMSLVNNSHLHDVLQEFSLPKEADLEIDLADSEMKARVRLFLPPTMKHGIKYPLLLRVYGGPNFILNTDVFVPPSFESYLVTRMNIVVAHADVRGSARRGDRHKFAMYRNLGGPEIEDFTTVAKQLSRKFSYIDPKRIGMWGWSYGGYATAMTLAKDEDDVFKCGISVAPVTSWIYYDSIYTERYMGLPTEDDNAVGYKNSDVTQFYENFKKKQFLLIHGNGDDNVHYQQSMALAKSLERHDIFFMMQSYPDEDHSLAHVRLHFIHTMERFWANCYGLNSTTT